jgi:hypothetical protein
VHLFVSCAPRLNLVPSPDMSGIAPYHDAPGASIIPPAGCKVSAAAFLIRHSCIHANDDEYADYMLPFVQRLERGRPSLAKLEDGSPVAFLKKWRNPIAEEDIEQLTGPGRDDAFGFGKRMRELYGPLLPPKKLGKGKKKKDKVKVRPHLREGWAATLTLHSIDRPRSKSGRRARVGILGRQRRGLRARSPIGRRERVEREMASTFRSSKFPTK